MFPKAALWFSLLVVFSLFVSAENSFEDEIQNLQGKEIPGIAGTLLGNQRINVHIGITDTEQITVGIITEDKKVKSAALADVTNPTLEVSTTQQTVQKVMLSQHPLAQLRKSFSGKEITYTVHGTMNKIKFSPTLLLFKWLGPTVEQNDSIEVMPTQNLIAEEEPVEEPASTSEETSEDESQEENETIAENEEDSFHTLELVGVGFPVKEITIKVGDTIVWKNSRNGMRYDKAMVLGTRICGRAKSSFFEVGESYQWTFEQKGSCQIVDGIYTTELMKVTVK